MNSTYLLMKKDTKAEELVEIMREIQTVVTNDERIYERLRYRDTLVVQTIKDFESLQVFFNTIIVLIEQECNFKSHKEIKINFDDGLIDDNTYIFIIRLHRIYERLNKELGDNDYLVKAIDKEFLNIIASYLA